MTEYFLIIISHIINFFRNKNVLSIYRLRYELNSIALLKDKYLKLFL